MAQEKFYDILVKEITAELRRELEEEMQNDPPTFQKIPFHKTAVRNSLQIEIPFFTSVEPKFFANKKGYYPFTKKSVTKTPPKNPLRLNREMTVEERAYHEVFLKLGANLEDQFNERDLKKEFRKLAHKYHPDHQIKADGPSLQFALDRFNQARSCYDKLCKALEK